MLYLMRHTKPAVAEGVCYGQLDLDLPVGYSRSFEKILETFDFFDPPPIVYTSPLKRCRLLADFLCRNPIVDKRLQELNFGDWEGQSWQTLTRSVTERWTDNYLTERVPGGESFSDLEHRLRLFLSNLSQDSSRSILVVTHAGPIRIITGLLDKIPRHRWMHRSIDYGEVIAIEMSRLHDFLSVHQ